MSVSAANKCIGLLGWLFGHKYTKSTLDSAYDWDHCFRCGRQAGQ